jgi:hypothetical protein
VNIQRYKSFRIDAFLCLSIGFIYYWVVPALAVLGVLDLSDPALNVVNDYISGVDLTRMFYYCLIGMSCYTMFFFGILTIKNDGINLGFRYASSSRNEYSKKLAWIFFIVLSLTLVVISAMPIREQFFKGYSADLFKGYNDGVLLSAIPRGRFTAATVILLVTTFCYLARYTNTVKAFILHPMFLVYLVSATFALSLGGRLYFISALFSVMVYLSLFRNADVSFKQVIIFGIVAIASFTSYGVIRAGGAFAANAAITNLLQEPLLTSLSLFSFLSYDNSIMIGQLNLFFIDFLNLIPSSLLPDKLALLADPRDYGFKYNMPLGGLHLYVSAVMKLGVFLMIPTSYFFGVYMAWMQSKSYGSITSSVIYSLICGWLVFSFYRDPWFVSLVKNIFEFSFVLPLLLSFLARGNRKCKR